MNKPTAKTSTVRTAPITSAVSANTPAKAQLVNALVALAAALTANYAEDATFELPIGTLTLPEITGTFDEYVTAVSEVGQAALAYHAAVERERSLRAGTLALRAKLKDHVAARVGRSATAMATYGFAPAKTRVTSPAAKLTGAVKAQATRVARGTKGKKQKAAIKGNVLRVTITPVTAPAEAGTMMATSATTVEASSAGRSSVPDS